MRAKKVGKKTAGRGKTLALAIGPEHRVERAAGEFRRGTPVLIRARNGHSAIAVAAETVTADTLNSLKRRFGAPSAILSHARAATLRIPLYTKPVVVIAESAELDARGLRALADPATDLDHPLQGPFKALRTPPSEAAIGAVGLGKLAGLLPAAAIFPISDSAAEAVMKQGALSQVLSADIAGFQDSTVKSLELVLRARVPLEGAEDAELVAFRPKNGGQEHYAVVIGRKGGLALKPPGPVLTRLHSECFTGDFLGSLKCDCGDQLRGAVRAIAAKGGGILLYLAQEGRGIGLMNKLRAYRLQDEGFDTMDANRRLGFEADERLYDIAARMLGLLGYSKVRLMTNNPDKVQALKAAGVDVIKRVAHRFAANPHNRAYLKTKADKGGHLL